MDKLADDVHALADLLDLLDIPFGMTVQLKGFYAEGAKISHAHFTILTELHVQPNLVNIVWLRDKQFRHIKIIQ
jgi:hypothetical protein